jgi:hypothetical protein
MWEAFTSDTDHARHFSMTRGSLGRHPTTDGLGVKILDIPSASGESSSDIANGL